MTFPLIRHSDIRRRRSVPRRRFVRGEEELFVSLAFDGHGETPGSPVDPLRAIALPDGFKKPTSGSRSSLEERSRSSLTNAELFEPEAKLLRAFASRRAVADETDPPTTRSSRLRLATLSHGHFERRLQPCKPRPSTSPNPQAAMKRPVGSRLPAESRPQKTPSARRQEENRGLRAVPPAERADAPEEGRELARNQHEEGEPCAQWVHLPSLEPNVLERLSGIPIEPGSRPVVTLARGEVALGNPCAGAVTGGR